MSVSLAGVLTFFSWCYWRLLRDGRPDGGEPCDGDRTEREPRE